MDYAQGTHGLTQSSKRAIEYFTLASEQGYDNAQYNLGVMYATGMKGIEQSDSKARKCTVKWWTKAAAQGHEEAIGGLKQLGCSYCCVHQNQLILDLINVKAVVLLSIAAANVK